MGLNFNLIKISPKTLSRFGTMGANDCIKVVQLGEKSPFRSPDFYEILRGPKGWTIRGEDSGIFRNFTNERKKQLQGFIRAHNPSCSDVYETGNRTIVQRHVDPQKDPFQGHLLGFETDKYWDTITYHTDKGHRTYRRGSECIKDFLKRFMKQAPKRKISPEELHRRLTSDFSEEIVKPVRDFLEGNLSKEELVKLIKKYRKNPPRYPDISKEEHILSRLDRPCVWELPKEMPDSDIQRLLRIRDWTLRDVYMMARKDRHGAGILLEEFLKAIKATPNQRTAIYRYVSKEEVDKILSGQIVKSRAGYNGGKCFDVTPIPDSSMAQYRVKFNIEANETTMGKILTENKPECEYYHWNVPQYNIKDVRSIVDQYNHEVLYESDSEVLSNFIKQYLSR